MKASLINKQGLVFETKNVSTKEEAIDWAKGRGICHLTVEVDAEKDSYIDYKIVNNRAHYVAL